MALAQGTEESDQQKIPRLTTLVDEAVRRYLPAIRPQRNLQSPPATRPEVLDTALTNHGDEPFGLNRPFDPRPRRWCPFV
jgi:hypothetical protein